MNRRHIDTDRRGRCLKNGRRGEGPVVYWLSRDQRVDDNWALLWAQQEALSRQKGLLVVFCLVPGYLGGSSRQDSFMAKGLTKIRKKLDTLNIPFVLFNQPPDQILPYFLRRIDTHALVCDFDPLRPKHKQKETLVLNVIAPIYEVDAHNIIPAWSISQKKEYAAYTIRPKIKRLLDDFLTDIPSVHPHPFTFNLGSLENFPEAAKALDSLASNNTGIATGETEALLAAKAFIGTGLENYSELRNNPCTEGQSGLSPYLHFGQLSAQRLAWMVSKCQVPGLVPVDAKDDFLEELIIRRELSDNFCLYEPSYDSFAGFPEWARKSLDLHRGDKRDYIYSHSMLEAGETHERLWNACQLDLVQSGKLHGYLRMYWAKKILEWTPDPETALEYAITLNDRYSLDGRDPSGYTGIAWSIGGVHDRAWRERAVFGKVRYMNKAGCRRKFDVNGYIDAIYSRQKG